MTSNQELIEIQLKAWQALVTAEGQHLLSLCHQLDTIQKNDASQIEKFRQSWPIEQVRAALQCSEARRKAEFKQIQGFDSVDIYADVESIEQATSRAVAQYKAQSLKIRLNQAALPTDVLDLCSGMGADSIALHQEGLLKCSVDHHPIRAWMSRMNTGKPCLLVDLSSESFMQDMKAHMPDIDFAGIQSCHLDPARRQDGKRQFKFEDLRPTPDAIARLLAVFKHSVIKLGPGTNPEDIPDDWSAEAFEFEYIQENSKLVQLLLWTGQLAGTSRRATIIDRKSDVVHTIEHAQENSEELSVYPSDELDAFAENLSYIYEPVPAFERAKLWDHPLLTEQPTPTFQLARGLGLLISHTKIESPWLNPFEIKAILPWREKHVKKWLRAHDGGHLEVKTRAKVVNPDQEQMRLRGNGHTNYTLFVLRLGKQVKAFIALRK